MSIKDLMELELAKRDAQYWRHRAKTAESERLQYARLLAEILATQDVDLWSLSAEMDLYTGEIESIFDRAQAQWDAAKAQQ